MFTPFMELQTQSLFSFKLARSVGIHLSSKPSISSHVRLLREVSRWQLLPDLLRLIVFTPLPTSQIPTFTINFQDRVQCCQILRCLGRLLLKFFFLLWKIIFNETGEKSSSLLQITASSVRSAPV